MEDNRVFVYRELVRHVEDRIGEIAEALLAIGLAMEKSGTEYSGAVHLIGGILSDLAREIEEKTENT